MSLKCASQRRAHRLTRHGWHEPGVLAGMVTEASGAAGPVLAQATCLHIRSGGHLRPRAELLGCRCANWGSGATIERQVVGCPIAGAVCSGQQPAGVLKACTSRLAHDTGVEPLVLVTAAGARIRAGGGWSAVRYCRPGQDAGQQGRPSPVGCSDSAAHGARLAHLPPLLPGCPSTLLRAP